MVNGHIHILRYRGETGTAPVPRHPGAGIRIEAIRRLRGDAYFHPPVLGRLQSRRIQQFGGPAPPPASRPGSISDSVNTFTTASVPPVRIFDPSVVRRLVGAVVGMLQIEQPGQQPQSQRGASRFACEVRPERALALLPVDHRRKPHQRVLRIDLLNQRLPR
jgi:hypothetical protein